MSGLHPYPDNLETAKRLLSWSDSIQIGVPPDAGLQASALALQMLRPLAASTWPGHLEALMLIFAYSNDEEESLTALVNAAAHDYPQAISSLQAMEDPLLTKRAERLRSSFNYDVD